MRRPAHWERLEDPEPRTMVFHIPRRGSFIVGVREGLVEEFDLEGTALALARGYSSDKTTPREQFTDFTTWGKFTGHGVRGPIRADGNAATARVFCGKLSEGRLLIISEISVAGAEAELEPQFEVVRSSLVAKPEPRP